MSAKRLICAVNKQPTISYDMNDMNLFSKITKIHDKQEMNMHVILLTMTH